MSSLNLKRPNVTTTTVSLMHQVIQYTNALQDIVQELYDGHAQVEMVCILGRIPSDWSIPSGRTRSERALSAYGTRVVFYSHLIENALNAYQAFLSRNKEAGRIVRLLDEIDESLEP